MSSTTTTQTITASEILRLFPDVNPTVIGVQAQGASGDTELEGYDEEQVRLMEELCIVIDENDKPIGSGSKKTCQCTHISLRRV
jgi:isopentenyl-diphosphate delta-isomerase